MARIPTLLHELPQIPLVVQVSLEKTGDINLVTVIRLQGGSLGDAQQGSNPSRLVSWASSGDSILELQLPERGVDRHHPQTPGARHELLHILLEVLVQLVGLVAQNHAAPLLDALPLELLRVHLAHDGGLHQMPDPLGHGPRGVEVVGQLLGGFEVHDHENRCFALREPELLADGQIRRLLRPFAVQDSDVHLTCQRLRRVLQRARDGRALRAVAHAVDEPRFAGMEDLFHLGRVVDIVVHEHSFDSIHCLRHQHEPTGGQEAEDDASQMMDADLPLHGIFGGADAPDTLHLAGNALRPLEEQERVQGLDRFFFPWFFRWWGRVVIGHGDAALRGSCCIFSGDIPRQQRRRRQALVAAHHLVAVDAEPVRGVQPISKPDFGHGARNGPRIRPVSSTLPA
mmetsp:Transcript_28327/g.68030  ORF Transcript_28327/g.68030 Transcript_28327/m.68030 type:complete len:399 (+) Transcript_28327:364-1560(+)